MKFVAGLFLTILLVATTAFSANTRKIQDRLEGAGTVMSEVLNMPDTIPQNVLNHTKCAIVIPSVKKGAFIWGAEYGRGAMVCHTGPNYQGPWGAPSMVALEGVSFGFQIGGQATDFVLLIMNDRGASSILKSKVKLGGDVSAAAGPVGREAAADTDAFMRSEVLTYSRARGVFAGISLEGATLHADNDANDLLYGQHIDAHQIVLGPEPPQPPQAAEKLITLLDKAAPQAAGD